jgi:hypothetical protein
MAMLAEQLEITQAPFARARGSAAPESKLGGLEMTRAPHTEIAVDAQGREMGSADVR